MADKIEVGQTYRATVDGLQAKARWDSIEVGDVIYIDRITDYGFTIQQVNGPAGGGLTRDELQSFERVGFHPNWNRVLQKQITARLLTLASKKRAAKEMLNKLPDEIQGYTDEISQLGSELEALQKERKS